MAERTYKTKPLYVIEIFEPGDALGEFEERITALLSKGWELHGAPAFPVGVEGVWIYQALRRPVAEIPNPAEWHEPDWKQKKAGR